MWLITITITLISMPIIATIKMPVAILLTAILIIPYQKWRTLLKAKEYLTNKTFQNFLVKTKIVIEKVWVKHRKIFPKILIRLQLNYFIEKHCILIFSLQVDIFIENNKNILKNF